MLHYMKDINTFFIVKDIRAWFHGFFIRKYTLSVRIVYQYLSLTQLSRGTFDENQLCRISKWWVDLARQPWQRLPLRRACRRLWHSTSKHHVRPYRELSQTSKTARCKVKNNHRFRRSLSRRSASRSCSPRGGTSMVVCRKWGSGDVLYLSFWSWAILRIGFLVPAEWLRLILILSLLEFRSRELSILRVIVEKCHSVVMHGVFRCDMTWFYVDGPWKMSGIYKKFMIRLVRTVRGLSGFIYVLCRSEFSGCTNKEVSYFGTGTVLIQQQVGCHS